MAEYVDKNVAIQICMDSWDASGAAQDIKDEPPSDVIERSKIDEAIEEMKIEIYCDNGFSQGVRRALEILKKNIGE